MVQLKDAALTQTLPHPAWMGWLLAVIIFAVGLGLRLYDLADPPLDFHPTRQIHSALIARGMVYEHLESAPTWQREMAVRQWKAEGLIEPQVFERLVALTYQWAGGAYLWIPRLYSILFWMIGAVFLGLLAVEFAGGPGALVGLLFFLSWPYAVSASRSFQPDPLMVALIAASVYAGSRWERQRTWAWTVAAGVLGGLAIYIKSVAVFFAAPALIALVVSSLGFKRAVRDGQVWVMAGLVVLPYLVYHIDGVYIRGFLVDQFSQRFFPAMWGDPAFYLRWMSNLSRAIPFDLCLVSIVGVFLQTRSRNRAVLLAMWAGYLACGMTLSHHISTHDYYHLPLFILVGLGLASVAQVVVGSLRGPGLLTRLVLAGVLAGLLFFNGYQSRNLLKRSSYSDTVQTWQKVGELVGPGASVVALTQDYGTSLAYWGWVAPVNWPAAEDLRFQSELGQEMDFPTRFDSLAQGRSFFVVSPVAQLKTQPDLEQYLNDHYPLYYQSDDVVIYDLRDPSKD